MYEGRKSFTERTWKRLSGIGTSEVSTAVPIGGKGESEYSCDKSAEFRQISKFHCHSKQEKLAKVLIIATPGWPVFPQI